MNRQPNRPRPVSLLVMLGANVVVAAVACVACFGLFSILPFSVAIVILPVNFFVFAFFHERMSGQQYFWLANGLFVATLGALMLAILLFGRSPFDFMLG